ncbi:hypothetical protein BV210_16705 [Halorientalis sp. IM1011]|nr:hypothetical protein BV210_16705 [Halorientalis sp. IM1011]
MPWIPHPLICWGIGVFVLDLIVLQGIKELTGYTATFFVNPTWVIQPVLVLFASFVVIFLHDRYRAVLEEIDVAARTTDPDRFDTLAPHSFRAFLYLLFLGYGLWQFGINVGAGTITEIGGVAELLGVAVVIPFGYGVIFSEFLATYVGIMLVFPRKVRRSDFRLNFLDPEGLGGLRPAGELMKTTYYFLVVGLVGFLVVLYGPAIVDPLTGSTYPDPGVVTNLLFTLVWVLSIVTMIYGLSQIHWFMKRTKREELTRLDRELRSSVVDPFDLDTFEIADEDRYNETNRRIEYVTKTQEYPTTFTMWMQILIGLILPKAIQMVMAYL